MRKFLNIFHSVTVQGLIFFLVVFAVYFRLIRPYEIVKDIVVRGNLAYLAVAGAGLRVVDITDSSALTEVGSYDTFGSANGIYLEGDYAYIADGNRGLIILDITDPTAIKSVGYLDIPGTAEDITVSGRFAYIATGRSGFQIINVADPKKPFKPDGFQDY